MPNVPTQQSLFIPRVVPLSERATGSTDALVAGIAEQAIAVTGRLALERADTRRKHQFSQQVVGLSVELKDKQNELSQSDDITAMREDFEAFAQRKIDERSRGIRDDRVREMFMVEADRISRTMAVDVGALEVQREQIQQGVELEDSLQKLAVLASSAGNDLERERHMQQARAAIELSNQPAEKKEALADNFRVNEQTARGRRMLREAPGNLMERLLDDPEFLPDLDAAARQTLITQAGDELERQIAEADRKADALLGDRSLEASREMRRFLAENPGDIEGAQALYLDNLENFTESQLNVFGSTIDSMRRRQSEQEPLPGWLVEGLVMAYSTGDDARLQSLLDSHRSVFLETGQHEALFTWESRLGDVDPARRRGIGIISNMFGAASRTPGAEFMAPRIEAARLAAIADFEQRTAGERMLPVDVEKAAIEIANRWLSAPDESGVEALPPFYGEQAQSSTLLNDPKTTRKRLDEARLRLTLDLQGKRVDPETFKSEMDLMDRWAAALAERGAQ